ncbi:DUF945 domain-containing protein [Bordetella hinzii]|uniref:DUF932 domain-containing protein n=1 Tax=Bordetella hinzii TaxID=103855 RepID=UPI0013EFCC2C|nr:DUF932 domain-containing protein [Bordetella hinzii]QII84191.1 DUF945 domain-containing protein [Bordetella hinzii]
MNQTYSQLHNFTIGARRNSPARLPVALTDDQIHRIAPSVFAEGKHESRSDRYTFIPTIDVLNGLRREGFEVVSATQGRTRIPGKAEFTRHMLRLRRIQDVAEFVGDEYPELVLVNSHDGTSGYQLSAGMYRLVCSNGLVVSSSLAEQISVHHKGDIVRDVIEGAFNVVDGFARIIDAKDEMKAITLSAPEQTVLARAAIVAKYGEPDANNRFIAHKGGFPVTADQVLTPRRRDDNTADLWTTFNRVQENLIKGDLSSVSASGRRQRTRAVKGISENINLNRALWQLAEGMKQIKSGVASPEAVLA